MRLECHQKPSTVTRSEMGRVHLTRREEEGRPAEVATEAATEAAVTALRTPGPGGDAMARTVMYL